MSVSSSRSSLVSITEPLQVALWRKRPLLSQYAWLPPRSRPRPSQRAPTTAASQCSREGRLFGHFPDDCARRAVVMRGAETGRLLLDGPEDVLVSSNGPRRHQPFRARPPGCSSLGDNAPEIMGPSLPNRRTIAHLGAARSTERRLLTFRIRRGLTGSRAFSPGRND